MVIPYFMALANSVLVHADEMILHKNVPRYGHFLSGMTLIWSNAHGDALDFVLIITFVTSLYEGGSRLKLWESSLKVFIHVGIRKSFLFPLTKTRSKYCWQSDSLRFVKTLSLFGSKMFYSIFRNFVAEFLVINVAI